MATEQGVAPIEVRFADDVVIREWTEVTMREDFADPLGELTFSVQAHRDFIGYYSARFAKGELVKVYVHGAKQGTYVVQTRTVTVDRNGGVEFGITCRSKLAAAYGASVNPKVSFKHPDDVPISLAVFEALGPFGFENIYGDSAASAYAMTGRSIGNRKPAVEVPSLKHKEAQAQENETAYQFAARITTRLGLAIRVTVDGDLLLCAPDYDQDPIATCHQTFGELVPGGDRFLRVTCTDTNEGQFSAVECRGVRHDDTGSTETAEPFARVLATDFSPTRPPYTSTAFPSKVKRMQDRSARDAVRAKNVATLALGLAAKDAFVVDGEVMGFRSKTGFVWTPDTIARVRVDADGFDEPLWLMSRTFTLSKANGARTRLRFIPLNFLRLGDTS